jgi:hypothetical protein
VAELQSKLEIEMAAAAQLPDALDQVQFLFSVIVSLFCLFSSWQVSEATDRCEQLRDALTKCECRLGAALEQVLPSTCLLISHHN